MQSNQILALIKKKIGSLILFGLLVAAMSFLTLVVTEKNFKSTVDFIIIQNQNSSQDYYTISKSSDYISRVLGESLYSEMFINEIQKTGKVNSEFLPFDTKEKLLQWSKLVTVKNNPVVGGFTITVFSNSSRDVENISNAIIQVVTEKSNIFIGGDGQSITIKVLSGPVIEKNPSIKKILLVSLGGAVLGILIAICWIIFQEEQRIKKLFQYKIAADTKAQNHMEQAGNFMVENEYRESIQFNRR